MILLLVLAFAIGVLVAVARRRSTLRPSTCATPSGTAAEGSPLPLPLLHDLDVIDDLDDDD
jgi:hypothetical protein